VQELPVGQGLLPPGELHTGNGPKSKFIAESGMHATCTPLRPKESAQVVPSGQSLCVSQWIVFRTWNGSQSPVPTA
jgi:hypothetical protein